MYLDYIHTYFLIPLILPTQVAPLTFVFYIYNIAESTSPMCTWATCL